MIKPMVEQKDKLGFAVLKIRLLGTRWGINDRIPGKRNLRSRVIVLRRRAHQSAVKEVW